MQNDPANWESMIEMMKAGSGGGATLCEKYGSTKSVELAGQMLLALAKLRDEVPKFAGEANSAIFRLLTTLPLWEMGPSMPELMLSYLNSAIREGLGVPPDADRGAVAEIIERIANAPDLTGGRLLEPLQIALINICLSLAGCGELNAVLATRPGSREAVILGIQQFSEQFKKERAMSELYSDSIEYVLEALRTR